MTGCVKRLPCAILLVMRFRDRSRFCRFPFFIWIVPSSLSALQGAAGNIAFIRNETDVSIYLLPVGMRGAIFVCSKCIQTIAQLWQ